MTVAFAPGSRSGPDRPDVRAIISPIGILLVLFVLALVATIWPEAL